MVNIRAPGNGSNRPVPKPGQELGKMGQGLGARIGARIGRGNIRLWP